MKTLYTYPKYLINKYSKWMKFFRTKNVRKFCAIKNSQLQEDTVDSFLMVLLSPIIYLHNKSLAWMKYVAPASRYQVLIESHFCHVNNLMMDLLISVYLLQEYTFHSKFLFIFILIGRSTILTKYAFSAKHLHKNRCAKHSHEWQMFRAYFLRKNRESSAHCEKLY